MKVSFIDRAKFFKFLQNFNNLSHFLGLSDLLIYLLSVKKHF
jgi:hypothetical protein